MVSLDSNKNTPEQKENVKKESWAFELTLFSLSTGKTEGQVVLRWGLQRGCSVIPKSENEGRIKANLDLFEFELDTEDMEGIKTLDKYMRFNNPAVFCEAAFKTFCPIFD